MSDNTFFWHDYETFGLNPARCRPAQFAGLRTDLSLNPIGDPLVIYCRPVADVLPSPEACLVTGITPQIATEKGVPEPEFISQINAEFSQTASCGVGFNSIRFDDEFTRYTLYRNFLDPYAREWQNQCSRWDIIDLVRMTYALRPEGIEWPKNESGQPTFKLERLAAANNLSHESAHDALSDVQATIDLARLIKNQQPRLFDWLFQLRNKNKVAAQIDIRSGKPFLHTTRMYPVAQGCTSMVLPLGLEPSNKSSVLVYDLTWDPEQFLELDQDTLFHRLFTRKQDLSEGENRLPVKSLKINKCPAIAPLSTMSEAMADRLGINSDQCSANRNKIIAHPDFVNRVISAYSSRKFDNLTDVDLALYQGFIGDQDKKLARQISRSSPEMLSSTTFSFEDRRLPELFFRYRARHWPHTLNDVESEAWKQHCEQCYSDPETGLESYFTRIAELREQHSGDRNQIEVLDALEQWGDSLF